VVAIAAVSARPYAQIDPERILTDHLQFSADEVASARAGQPIVKMLPSSSRDQFAVAGAVRVAGKKERLADWIRNIEHFRTSAQLGRTHPVALPPTAAAFADAHDQRDVLFGYASAYVSGGDKAVAAHGASDDRGSFADDTHLLMQQATTVKDLAPDLVRYLDEYPKGALTGVEQRMYWSAMPNDDTDPILSVHHLVVHPAGHQVWIADKTIYASRYIQSGIVTLALYDTPDGTAYYVIAGSRLKASELTGFAATLLRRKIESDGLDTVRMYLEWLRDSLALT
jgi:hypothetical protein